MPNDAQISLQTTLSSLEELQNGHEEAVFSTLDKDHLNLLQSLKTLLSNRVELSPRDADRVLSICLRYILDVRCILDVFSIISELIDIDKYNSYVDFLPFGIALMKFLNTKCHEDNTVKLRILSVQLLMKHPKSTLQILIRHHSENFIQTFQPIFGLNQAEDLPSKIEAFKLLTMLEWLPHNEKRLFMEAGISLWLSGVIPAMMQIVVSDEDVNKIEACLSYTEMLASELVCLKYYENQHWKSLLLCIANPEMFPASIMSLFEKGKANWHRIWIILIKIAKSQVTQYCSPFSNPISSMLPIVETAFKKESAQRVRAFACWDELIQSFSNEIGCSTKKIIKLIMVPLKVFNTKTEETAVAKFHTWWQLIHKFRPKIPNQKAFINDILIDFLHFMFGMDQARIKYQASQVSDYLRKRCIEAFEEIMNLKRVDGNIATINLLDHWKDFVYILKSCIWAVAQSYTKNTKEKVQSIWLSFVMRLAAMAENTVRQNMFDDLINIVSALILENENIGNENLMEILVDDITLSLWRDNKLKTLTKSRSQSYRPMHSIVKLIMDDQFNNYFKRVNSEELTKLLQPLISTLLEESISKPEYIIWLLDELRVTNTTLVMWTALAQASKETKLSLEAFNKILIWPFKTVHISCEVKEAAEAWHTLYNKVHENLEKTNFYYEISKVMKRPVEDSKASNYFVLLALIGVLKHKPDVEKMEKLEALTYEMNDYNDFEELLTPLVKSVVLMINNSTDENLAHVTMNCVENILKGIKSETEAMSDKSPVQNITMLSDTITSTLNTYLKECPYQSIKNQVRSLLSLYDKKTESPKKVSESPKKVNDSPDVTYVGFSGWGIPPKEFASPEVQKIKKEARIVAKVVENGEEYVVIKSNWKFNPKNLTENQKEKFQRKKSDIPALYGDQSQSQEFKLTSWKTDSQDTSLSSSKSATSNDVSDTLKKITNSNIVPKIMENILDIEKNSKPKTDATVSPIAEVKTLKAVIWSTPGGTKSPRMALKDRVCRNVRNLIGNSSLSPHNKMTDKNEDTILQNVSKSPLNQPEIVCKESPAKVSKSAESNEKNLKPSNDDLITTDKQENNHVTPPPMKKNIVSTQRIDQMMRLACTPVSNTQKKTYLQLPAPQTPSVERPMRSKKTPKKFDDSLVTLVPLKRRRYSKNYSQSNSQDWLESHTETVIAQIHNPNDKMDVTDANSPQKLSSDEADTNENAKKSPTTTEVVIIVENVTSCAASDDKIHKDSEKTSLISPQTSINKPTAKSPVKSSKDEVQCSLRKVSEVVDDDAAQNETYDVKDKPNVKTTSSKPSELQTTSVKKVSATHDLITNNHRDTPNISPKKCRKSNVEKDSSANDENDAVNTPVTANTSLKKIRKCKEISAKDKNAAANTPVTTGKKVNEPKLSAQKRVLQNDTDMNVEKVEVVPISINVTEKDSDTGLLKSAKLSNTVKTDNNDEENLLNTQCSLRKVSEVVDDDAAQNETYDVKDQPNVKTTSSKPSELQTTSVKKVSATHDLITNSHRDTPNISPKKCRKSNVEKGSSANDENDAVNTPVTADTSLKKIRKCKEISAKDKNAAANTPVTTGKKLNEPKLSAQKRVLQNDTDMNVEKVEVVPISINVTEKDSDTGLLKSAKLSNTVKTNNNDEENLLNTPKTQKKKRSRIEKELAIDMVEGHPFLKTQSAKRLTRKKLKEVGNGSKRQALVDKLNKYKLGLTLKTSKKVKTPLVNSTISVEDSQDKALSVLPQNITDEPPCSEDVIESSQDSTMTTISVNAKMRTVKRVPIVTLEKIFFPITLTQDRLQDCTIVDNTDTDIELPQNKSAESDNQIIDLTENMDTEPIGDSKNTTDLTENIDTETLSTNETDDPIILSETLPTHVTVDAETEPVIGPDTQELAEADTQPNNIKQFEQWEINNPLLTSPYSNHPESSTIEDNDITQSLPEDALIMANMGVTTEVSSPLKDDNQRKQDFLNNTVEISPIKVQSPIRQKKSPSPEISTDFVIQLSSPVHSNGEPFDKQCSPEFFTEDKSPDKHNASPPRVEETVTNSSPSASLSLKKNRPQVNRPCSGRAAQMLASVSSEMKNHSNRALISFKYTGNDCSVEENATVENFLKLQRSLPKVTSSPSGPILKRKLDEITDDSTASPASKKKRVSFHDPPVSTTVSIQKYIEPISLTRSPQTSTKKRQTRSGLKSPKKLDNAFLDSALSKTVESFTEATTPSDETENISLDVTPVVEIVKTSELNDTDPICPDLIDCTDPIDVIAIELSSAAMRDLFVKELEGKVDTVGDLAKMTELEVNRLCIKAPKITVAKKVLTDYVTNRPAIAVETVIEEAFSEPMTESLLHETKSDMEVQTDKVEVVTKSTQVAVEEVTSAETQTEVVISANTSVQTIESGCKTKEEIIDSCLSEADSFEIWKGKLNDEQVESVADLQSKKTRFRKLLNEMGASTLIHKTLKQQSKGKSDKPSVELTFLMSDVLEKYGHDAVQFCIDFLNYNHNKFKIHP